MIVGLDSAQPPTRDQALAARASGIRLWSGYLSAKPQVGLYHPWSRADFANARLCGGKPIAFCSGWDDPAACKALAQQWNVRLCLDVESGIRGDGPWVQAWLDASGAGLYGVASVHAGRRAAFHILAWYTANAGSTWAGQRPPAPCGWQFENSHNEFGVTVDRGYYDDFFGGEEKVLRIMVNPRDGSEWLTDDMSKRPLGPATASKMATKYGNPQVEDQAVFDSIPEAGAAGSAASYQGTVTLKPV